MPNISFSRALTTQLPGKDTYYAIYTVIQLMICCMGKTTFHCMIMKYSLLSLCFFFSYAPWVNVPVLLLNSLSLSLSFVFSYSIYLKIWSHATQLYIALGDDVFICQVAYCQILIICCKCILAWNKILFKPKSVDTNIYTHVPPVHGSKDL